MLALSLACEALPVLELEGLRPTPDRVRETLFNWLGRRVQGARCLDRFAGRAFRPETLSALILRKLAQDAQLRLGPVAGAISLELIIQTLAGGGTGSVFSQIGLGVLLAVCVIFIPRGVIDFFGGRSRLSLRYFRQTLRETSA